MMEQPQNCGWTRHGHPIEGVLQVLPQPAVARCGGPRLCTGCAVDAARASRNEGAIDAAHLERQRRWSTETFGPGTRLGGVLDHIGKELDEIRADPTDLGEWVDVLILAFDGAWRAGWEPQQIIDAIKAKQAKNEARTWPDWRTMSADQAIEHDRSVGG